MSKETITLRCRYRNGITDVRCRILHTMNANLCQDEEESEEKPHFIQKVLFEHNGETVATFHVGPGISDDPFFNVGIKETKKGDQIRVSWVDNKGESDAAEVTIS